MVKKTETQSRPARVIPTTDIFRNPHTRSLFLSQSESDHSSAAGDGAVSEGAGV